ncbi:hypothetical protein HanXRQr2_Chr05g0204161 [Helianthus annuus]|uniref:Uncharacterized protein n=1 Tax=Helianthus annuus TaxID=4232 RepID=A0A251UNA9_HELAN|nr:hypothetical protein HanXRQr2_Chr05g0204161 [Helianthus annuus]KAJ0583874.1 hypothetical protein HanHA89_Chr05g0181691 [Helianthus annuus]
MAVSTTNSYYYISEPQNSISYVPQDLKIFVLNIEPNKCRYSGHSDQVSLFDVNSN